MTHSVKKNKFSKNPNYKAIFKKPPLLVSKDFSIWITDNEKLGLSRFGVIVAKKNVRLAVTRNLSKRISKELFKKYKDLFINKDLILVVKNNGVITEPNIWKEKLENLYTWLNHFGS